MKNLWIKIGLAIGGIVAFIVLFREFAEHENIAHEAVMVSLPKQIGIASEAYKKKVAVELALVQNGRKDEIVAKFKKAFGG